MCVYILHTKQQLHSSLRCYSECRLKYRDSISVCAFCKARISTLSDNRLGIGSYVQDTRSKEKKKKKATLHSRVAQFERTIANNLLRLFI